MAYTDIDKPSDYFNTVTYSGNSSNPDSVTGVGFQPDFVWVKTRNFGNTNHRLQDAVRGSNKRLMSDLTNAETDAAGGIQSFDSDGFTVGDGTSKDGFIHFATRTFVAWNWKANGSGVSNTDGSITSSVSANTDSGFSIVSFTGSGTHPSTVGHNLGAVPQIVIVKARSEAQSWYMYNYNLGNNKIIELNSTSASYTDNNWNSTTPTSSVFTVSNNNVNENTQTYIAYCFAEIKGYSKFGSYTGNGNADGTFIYTGFKPAWIMAKASSRAGRWRIWDNKINPFNVADTRLSAESSDAENTGTPNQIDIVSNGFKIRTSEGQFNGSGETNIFMAFAENPFVTSTGIPTTAR